MNLDQASAVVIGAVVGAAASLLGGFLAGWRQSRLEEEKWRRTREDAVRSDTRASLAGLAKTLASVAHSIMWSTYKAISSAEVTEDELAKFEAEFHGAVSEMVSAQMHIAALDHSLFVRVTPLVSEAISLGGEAYDALRASVHDAAVTTDELSGVNGKALKLIKRVPNELANVLRS